MYSMLKTLSEYIYTFTYQKTLLHGLFCLFLKLSKAFSVSLIVRDIKTSLTIKDPVGSFKYIST